MLFAQFGEEVAEKYIKHAVVRAADSQEAPQRYAAEVAAAALRAPRYWRREPALRMYNRAMEIINAGIVPTLSHILLHTYIPLTLYP
jgi:hypothetical protein